MPRIGITPCSRVIDYVESVRRAGGDPVVLATEDQPEELIECLDGLLLTGGADIDPVLYGEPAHPTTNSDPLRDRFEIPLARAAVASGLPLFAICRGVQVLNVAEGGTLVQDIPSAVRSDLPHAIDVPKDAVAHSIRITPGSRLAESLGPAAGGGTCDVNSRHHQAVKDVAPGFVVTATSADGVIEAIERPGAAFCLGVQWHPENFWRSGQFAPLFAAFVEAARRPRP
jgi:putative glutamine amidotransferase